MARLRSPCTIMIFLVASTLPSVVKANACSPGSTGSGRPSSSEVNTTPSMVTCTSDRAAPDASVTIGMTEGMSASSWA